VMLKGASFSPMFWKSRHFALVDIQRQLGYPTMFYTVSPYEWSFPYHKWMLDEMDKDLRTRLHLPAGETMHLAHALMELAQGYLMGTNSNSARADKQWKSQLLQDAEGKRVVRNFCARLEFQSGKRKQPTQSYNPGGDSSNNWGRGAVHLHLLVWTMLRDPSCLEQVLSATVPVDDAVMAGYVLGSQPSWGSSGWTEREEPTAVSEYGERLLLQHKDADDTNGMRAYFPAITKATKGSHQDLFQADGQGLLLKYVSTSVPKVSDEFAA